MISIIVCSQTQSLFNDFSNNIKDTARIEYEIIRIDNSANQYSICEAYNVGAKQALYPILCFIHEDVAFETNGWGEKVARYFDNKEIGVLGVAGSSYRSGVPTSWGIDEKHVYKNLIQGYKYSKREPVLETSNLEEGPAEVVVVDGVFIATQKSVWEKCPFDQVRLKGFHGYDMDFSLQVKLQTSYRVKVVPDILLTHYSEGKPDLNWIKSARIVANKWKKELPVCVHKLSFIEQRELHWLALTQWITRLKVNKVPKTSVMFELFKYSSNPYFKPISFLRLFKRIVFN